MHIPPYLSDKINQLALQSGKGPDAVLEEALTDLKNKYDARDRRHDTGQEARERTE